jgi:dihydrofolate reductase
MSAEGAGVGSISHKEFIEHLRRTLELCRAKPMSSDRARRTRAVERRGPWARLGAPTSNEEGAMGRLTYSAITSVDGYVADADGRFDWSAPDEEVHAFVNDLERRCTTFLYGRRMYEVMAVWETMGLGDDESPIAVDFADLWRAADKVVFSRTLDGPTTPRTRLERDFDPDAVRRLVADSAADVSIGGPGLAAHALRAGLVDEVQLFVTPHVVGGGTAALPDGVRLDLELCETRSFDSGVVFLRYRPTG